MGEREEFGGFALSIPIWLAAPYLAMLGVFFWWAGHQVRDLFAIAFVAAFSFQFWWACALRGEWQRRRATDLAAQPGDGGDAAAGEA